MIRALVLFISTASFCHTAIIYGIDNRKDSFETTNELYLKLASSTAAMISNNKIRYSGPNYRLRGHSLGYKKNLCGNEKFYDQISPAKCTGFLVAEDTIATAAHCVDTLDKCNHYSWVFDFKVNYYGDNAKIGPRNNVYHCKKVVEIHKPTLLNRSDYALIKLDRKVDRDALKLNFKSLSKDASLLIIGHPSGLPQKIADGAKVRRKRISYFITDTDSFAGNSGSPVFNSKTGLVEGILVKGDKDYLTHKEELCDKVNTVKQNKGDGEQVIYIKNIKSLQKQ